MTYDLSPWIYKAPRIKPKKALINKGSGSDLGGTKTQRIILRDNVADGVRIKLRLNSNTSNQGSVHIDLHCPGEEVIYDGTNGELISRRTL